MGATYGVNVGYDSGPAGGALLVTALVDETRAGEVTERILAVLAALRDDAAGHRETFVRARKKVLSRSMAQSGGATAAAAELTRAAQGGHGSNHGQIIASKVAGLTVVELGTVAAADLDATHRVVFLRGKRAALEAAYAHLAVTPERIEDERKKESEETETKAGKGGKPAPAAPTTAEAPQPTRGDAQLYIGSKHAVVGPKEDGLFLGERKLTVDEFLTVAGGDRIRSRMSQRRWMRRSFLAGGLIAMVAGATYSYTTDVCSLSLAPPDKQECEADRSSRKTTGAIVAVVGVALALTHTQIGRGTPTDDELNELARRYNRRPIAVAPVAVPGGGGLVVSGGF
jgi:hypothetical protein